MSSDYDYAAPRSPLPPPPPPPPLPQPPAIPQLPVPGSTQTSPLRRIAVQPPLITTALAPPQGGYHPAQTPLSATALNVPFSPYAAQSPSTYAASPVVSSPMTMRGHSSVPYNPQQWGRSGPVAGAYVPYASPQAQMVAVRPPEVTGMEASMPSPPPPYSPGQGLSPAVGPSPHMSSTAFAAPQNQPTSAHPSEYIPSSSRPMSGFDYSRPTSMVMPTSAISTTSNHQFPPPPPRDGMGRSASRDKSHSKFSLSSFRNRNVDHSPAPSAIENLRINTSDALSRTPGSPGLFAPQVFVNNAYPDRRYSPDSPIRAPAARRAASAGALSLAEARTPIEYSPSPVQGNWGPGMPLPPPPPGPPPPSGSRSQSLGPGASRTPVAPHLQAPPTRRPGQSSLAQSSLGPIPPTPVGWQEEQTRIRSRSPAARGLYIDTSPKAIRSQTLPVQLIDDEEVSTSSGPTASTSRTSNSTSTLYRSPPRRETSARGIRERRSESRAARDRVEPNNNPWAGDMEAASGMPTDLVLTNTPDGSLSRRNAVTKGTPRSAGVMRSPRSSQILEDTGSSTSTPRVDASRATPAVAPAPTPPFSPGMDTPAHHFARKVPTTLPSKALPTPPLRYYDDEYTSGLTNPSENGQRSASQISRSEARLEESSASTPRPASLDMFAQGSIERHRLFIEKETSAQTDHERLELFAEFIVNESRLRRDRYSAAFDAMSSDVLDLTRDLWRSYGSTGRRSVTPAGNSISIPSGRRSQASTIGESPDTRFSNSMPTTAASPASSVANFTPHTEPNSPASASSQRARDQTWNNNTYQPCLSPIPSMAMSTVPDEEDSRGRSASRWWEASNEGGSTGIGDRRLERSKRESKYMGLPKEARESLQWENRASPESSTQTYGPNEYPPEKIGFHEEAQPTPTHGYHSYPQSVPSTPDPRKLDVSRLVTLPPPFPRHHPAVNNSHPDLTSIRANLRGLAEMDEVETTKDAFKEKIESRKEQEKTGSAERKAELRYNIQENIRTGVMSYGDAAKAEADFEAQENKRAQDLVQNIFDTYQSDVANPLHALFCERIIKATASVDHIKGRLSDNAQELNPNQTQEEGDEQPELLEMLTLLKWLFEAREQLHKEMFELEDERNDLYKDIIVLPYIQAKNEQKVKEAKTFFEKDAQDRRVVFEKEILKRYEEFMNVIEQNVTRGVEAQLSAFWDIAPGLLAVVQKIPQRLDGLDILIPPQEYEENPAYDDYPLQYMYSLLAHAGRSAYQFIESQINLLCLLHEVKTGVMKAGSRLLETQRIYEGEDLASVDEEMRAIREDEEARLTYDLKDKVGLVESQWDEALGRGLGDCKTRVEAFLQNQGGWDDSLKE
ncbi:hypothetical protein P154DRAFT_521439 [Amniculicola lignicola CBS 123094]|uniref:Uncharacterized protein n=1 Tax=Amniculicola lignicola CBS 123094 TaxID=1392246 RepID=A0A6A5WKK4_9PLEO|nr:hypothetical protein P154DRAFT_521439 [Amniculicola lignicola CBS 123094]